MNRDDQEAMLGAISRVFGPFTTEIRRGKTVIQVSPPPQPIAPLVGYGDTVEVGQWVYVIEQGKKGDMPLQVVHYELDKGHPAIFLKNRVTNASFCYAEPGGMVAWRTFQVVALDDVPLYLREPLPRDQAAIDGWKMLSKAQLLEKFQHSGEAVCYVVMFQVFWREPKARPVFVHRDVMPVVVQWEPASTGKKRKLSFMGERYATNGNPYGAKPVMGDNGYIVADKAFALAIFDPAGSGFTLKRFMRHLVKPKWKDIV
jgi:hypothetical protein